MKLRQLVPVWVPALALTLVLVAVVVRCATTNVYPNGWHQRQPGTWPWGTSNEGNYMCLRWNSDGETWDTLLSPVYDLGRRPTCTLYVRTLYRYGRPSREQPDLPTAQIIGTADDWQTWHVVRDYGHVDFHGYETLDISGWAGGHHRVAFAWVAHTWDSVNIRYWCMDDVRVGGVDTGHSSTDLAVTQLLHPHHPNVVLAPADTIPLAVRLVNLGYNDCPMVVTTVIDDSVRLETALETLPYASSRRVELRQDPPHPYGFSRSSGGLAAGCHSLLVIASEVIDASLPLEGKDTLHASIRVASDTWQKMPSEYPMPDRTIRQGLAMAGGPDGNVYVRHPGGRTPAGASVRQKFMALSILTSCWNPLPDYPALLKNGLSRSVKLCGAVVAHDSLFYCLVDDCGPMAVYNAIRKRWSATSLPRYAALEYSIRPDFAGGIGWDGYDRLYVLGNREIYWYSIKGDTWNVLGGDRQYRLPSDCADNADMALCGAELFMLQRNRNLISYSNKWDAWCERSPVPGTQPVSVCRMAADPKNGRIYMLTDAAPGMKRCFVCYSIAGDSWILGLPQPLWSDINRKLEPGAQLVRVGRYLLACNGGDNDIWMYNLPAPPACVSRPWY